MFGHLFVQGPAGQPKIVHNRLHVALVPFERLFDELTFEKRDLFRETPIGVHLVRPFPA